MSNFSLTKSVAHGLLLAALSSPAVASAQDNPFLANPPATASASASDEELLTAKVSIDFTERPEDNGGNLFLVGFEEVDELNMPMQDSRPADFKQLGVWIKTWPHTQQVELVKGLHYMVLYGYSEYPSPKDLTSKAMSTDQISNGVLSLSIEQSVRAEGEGGGLERDQPPANAERVVEIIPEELQATPTQVVVRIAPAPEELGGTVFLTGFSEVDGAMNLPARGAEPVHFQILQTDVQSDTVNASVKLQSGLGYLAIYGHGIHPETGDRMSLVTDFTEAGTLELSIEDQLAGEPPEDVLGQPEAVDASTAGNAVPPPPSQEAAPIAEPAEATQAGSSSKIWLVIPLTLLILLGFFWTQRGPASAPTSSRLERVGESEDDS